MIFSQEKKRLVVLIEVFVGYKIDTEKYVLFAPDVANFSIPCVLGTVYLPLNKNTLFMKKNNWKLEINTPKDLLLVFSIFPIELEVLILSKQNKKKMLQKY